LNCLCECRHSVDNYTYSSVCFNWWWFQLVDWPIDWSLLHLRLLWECVLCFQLYIYIILLLKTAQNVFKNEHNGAWFGITVLWSVVMAFTIVITVACSGADDTWQFGVYKNTCCFNVVKFFRFFWRKTETKNLLIFYLFIDWFVSKCFCTERKSVLLLIISAIKLKWHTVTLQIHGQY
jgi:hypothetical protein